MVLVDVGGHMAPVLLVVGPAQRFDANAFSPLSPRCTPTIECHTPTAPRQPHARACAMTNPLSSVVAKNGCLFISSIEHNSMLGHQGSPPSLNHSTVLLSERTRHSVTVPLPEEAARRDARLTRGSTARPHDAVLLNSSLASEAATR